MDCHLEGRESAALCAVLAAARREARLQAETPCPASQASETSFLKSKRTSPPGGSPLPRPGDSATRLGTGTVPGILSTIGKISEKQAAYCLEYHRQQPKLLGAPPGASMLLAGVWRTATQPTSLLVPEASWWQCLLSAAVVCTPANPDKPASLSGSASLPRGPCSRSLHITALLQAS